MRLDMGDMQEALKAHDAWMEDVSQSLQEVHERCQQLSEDIESNAQSTQTKLDAKTDITAWNDMTDDIDASIKTVRDMASALRLEVDSRRRKVDEDLGKMREQMKILQEKVDNNASNIQRLVLRKPWKQEAGSFRLQKFSKLLFNSISCEAMSTTLTKSSRSAWTSDCNTARLRLRST